MPTKQQSKDWACKCCKRENLETIYFVCPVCIEEVRRTHIYKEREKRNNGRK